jgi:phenol 2-monooxygenase
VCTIQDLVKDRSYTIRTKYLVGADGGKSFVRKTAGIAFEGTRTTAKWIRMDALVNTDMPSPRTLNSVQSDTHGLVLFCPIDEGKTRIGYVFNDELKKKYGEQDITAEVAMAVRPIRLLLYPVLTH